MEQQQQVVVMMVVVLPLVFHLAGGRTRKS
jgi:hypothetical protein